ncbi:LAMI_0H00518g1_1 [Lachancea mirantina]|uniref:LAMI_0H00518g1_1 n=1 Tax=Lachancea mirantina TaxID=1230905 RepID=A0A1G4KDF8_9SACH|nr:LAMI_0H00518g1_1 [Lachancea mirantina]
MTDNTNQELKDHEKAELNKSEDVAKALADPVKKRKADDEIEIDLDQPVPLSKKQKRLLRRGKVSLEELNAKFNIDPSSIEEYKSELQKKEGKQEENIPGTGETADSLKENDVKKFGVWIGNLSFDTTKEDLKRFFLAKTKELDENSRTEEADILRINLPLAQNDGKQVRNKGFAHMDFRTQKQMDAVIALSESQLNGRNLLIKNASSFAGRPDKTDLISMSKNPPSRILFVGNLSFDTTDELLKKHFQHCGDIVKIRMATFQDSGKCKGFAFVDFKNEEGATNALKDKTCRKIAGRTLRMEFGEDRSKRQVKRRPAATTPSQGETPEPTLTRSSLSEKTTAPYKERKPASSSRTFANARGSNERQKSSIALATAQRASAAIVPSQGKKKTFD